MVFMQKNEQWRKYLTFEDQEHYKYVTIDIELHPALGISFGIQDTETCIQ